MSLPTLDNRAARRIFLDRHSLLETPAGEAKGRALHALIHKLGFVQIDSINTVARAHDLILFSRRPRYRPNNLKRLYEYDRALFEHWTHDAAIIPMEFFPWWRMRMRRDADMLRSRWRNWRRHGFEEKFRDVLDHIRDHGPCCSSDVGRDEARSSGGWWDWHPSKTALEYLWRSGALTVVGRDGFRKRYDLTERVIEHAFCDEGPSEADTIDWCCAGALDRLGFATPGELARFWDHITPAEARDWCDAARDRGEVIDIAVIQANGRPRKLIARPDILDDPAAQAVAAAPARLRVLSPFDPALRDRKRTRALFGFDYKIEIFVPAAKRRYGYYVFPVLQGDRIIARVDMKAHRDRDLLHVRRLWPEPGVRWSPAKTRALEAECERLTRLADVSKIGFAPDWIDAATH